MQGLAQIITKIIDFFYKKVEKIVPEFGKIVSPEFFRYGFCGGGNMVLDWVLYFLIYNFVLRHEMLELGFVTISSHIAAFCIVFPITLMTGFWLNKYVTFTQSTLRGWHQLYRYIVIVGINLLVNYIGLKFFVEVCGFYPTPSKMLVTVITVIISYLGQKYYSFRK